MRSDQGLLFNETSVSLAQGVTGAKAMARDAMPKTRREERKTRMVVAVVFRAEMKEWE